MSNPMNWIFCDSEAEWWIGETLRAYHQKHLGGLRTSRRPENWIKLLEWHAQPEVKQPRDLDNAMREFLSAAYESPDRNNPWEVVLNTLVHRRGPRGAGGFSYRVAEFSIPRALSSHEQRWYMQDRSRIRRQLEESAPYRQEREQRERELESFYRAICEDEADTKMKAATQETATIGVKGVLLYDFNDDDL